MITLLLAGGKTVDEKLTELFFGALTIPPPAFPILKYIEIVFTQTAHGR